MPAASCSEQDFIDLFRKHGARGTSKILNIGERKVHERRRRLEKSLGVVIETPNPQAKNLHRSIDIPQRLESDIRDGIAVVASDCHYWPGIITTAHRALIKFLETHDVHTLVMNGDVLDGSRISRHPPIGWEDTPTLIEEIEACGARLGELEDASPNSEKVWTLGNHDARFETRLASIAPEYAKVHGVHLKDHFPNWKTSFSLWVNDDVVIKHRLKGGVHATHNNTVASGKTVVTGHLHSLKVTPYSDYNGTRYGVDTGTLADPYGPQFNDYTEDAPVNWRSGFAVLTFKDGRLLYPEVVHVFAEGRVEFRGKTYDV